MLFATLSLFGLCRVEELIFLFHRKVKTPHFEIHYCWFDFLMCYEGVEQRISKHVQIPLKISEATKKQKNVFQNVVLALNSLIDQIVF